MSNLSAPLRPVLLIGGTGTRLWPLSRGNYPKQFLPLLDNDVSPLQATYQRISGLGGLPPIFIANEEHRFIVAEQLRTIGLNNPSILLEPVGRNTAPAIALAALLATADGEDPLLLVLPSDHVIANVARFQEAVTQAMPAALQGKLLTFGVQPSYPETGYGYLLAGEIQNGIANVERFVEKPNAETAQAYIDSGNYYWNSGMFLFRASSYLHALEQQRPDIAQACRQTMMTTRQDGDFLRLDEAAFTTCPAESIDYAVMEHSDQVAMVPLDTDWNDIGSFASLWQIAPQDDQGNALRGDVMAEDCQDIYAYSEHRLLALLGLKDTVVVETADAVLVAARDRVQDIRLLVDRLKKNNRPEATAHRQVYRPWGHYDTIDSGSRFQVKRICVAPGAHLSLQMHHHRAEHWIVVRGTARVTRGDEVFLLSENQSTYIPLGVTHRLENPGTIELELIEVQSGSYLGEDDIVRFDDKYGR